MPTNCLRASIDRQGLEPLGVGGFHVFEECPRLGVEPAIVGLGFGGACGFEAGRVADSASEMLAE